MYYVPSHAKKVETSILSRLWDICILLVSS